jgi:hypothetical protein
MSEIWKEELMTKWGVELSSASLRGKLPIGDLIRYQILKCLEVGTEESENAIVTLHNMIPKSWWDDELREDVNKTEEEVTVWDYQKWCGVNMGTPNNPITSDGKPPDEDWSNVISPLPRTTTVTNYDELFHACLNLFDRRGLFMEKMRTEVIPGSLIEDYENDSEE